MKRKFKRYLIPALCLCALWIAIGLYNPLRIQRYEIDASEIQNPIRIALIADLHACSYGQDNAKLVDEINREAPDIIVLAGDIFDDRLPNGPAEAFMKAIGGTYPCYYVTGNHEHWSDKAVFKRAMQTLKEVGAIRLSGEADSIAVNGETILICGVDDPVAARNDPDAPPFDAQLAQAKALSEGFDGYSILLSHRPERLDRYVEAGFDLALCGHAHGGQWRIPGLLNGLYAPNQGVFPKYAGGKYIMEPTTMIVSRGLAKESTRIPRFYNRPELVIIDLY